MKSKRLYYVVMPFVMAITLLISLFTPLVPTGTSNANEIAGVTGLSAKDAVVTSASTGDENLNKDGTVANADISTQYKVTYNFTLPSATDINNGDTVKFYLPENLQIKEFNNQDFDVTIKDKNDQNIPIGKATISAGQTAGTITFTNPSAIKSYGRHGTLEINAYGTKNTNSHPNPNQVLQKSGWKSSDNNVTWQILYNYKNDNLGNVTITDTMGPNQTYDSGSLYWQTVDIDDNGKPINEGERHSISDDDLAISKNENGTTLTIKLKNVTHTIQIIYTSMPDENVGTVTNTATDGTNSKTHTSDASVTINGSGNITSYEGKVSLKKVGSTDSNKGLKGAVFEIIDKNNNDNVVQSDLTTDKNGELTATNLADGSYAFKETKAPDGYELSNTEYPFTISETNRTDSTYVNKPITNTPTTTTSLTVTKKWSGNDATNRPSSVQVQLYANGEKSGDQITLSSSNDWKHTFSDLAKTDKDGKEINYTAKEVNVPDGYTSKTTTDGNNVTITNTYTPFKPTTSTTELKVNKVWNDNNNAAGLRPSEVQVQLYANGEKSSTPITLNLGNNWSYDFTNLPEKDANGDTITYTAQEVNTASDYVSTIDNSQKGQVTITNTYTPPVTPTEDKTNYTVNKIWNDEDNKDGKRPESVQIQLYANGEKSSEPITLSSANGWAYTFNNLSKTDQDGKEIKYTAKEINVTDGYTSSVDVSEAGKATITNTYTPSTPPTKPDKPNIPTQPSIPDKPTIPDTPTYPSTPIKPGTPSITTKPTTPSTSNTPPHSSSSNYKPKSEENTPQKLINRFLPQTGSSFTNLLAYVGLLVVAMVILLSGIALVKRNKD